MSSGMGKSANRKERDPTTITYTKTFEVQNMENDETSLVRMDEFGSSRKPKVQSSSTSISSLEMF